MSSLFAFQVAEPIIEQPTEVRVHYDEDTQLSVWQSDNNAAMVTLVCTGYPAGLYISCVNTVRFGCTPGPQNTGSGYGYRCDPAP
ncbi:hypothetical protein WEH80_18625 [Actinomycetes bacterium KLBMP 9759]